MPFTGFVVSPTGQQQWPCTIGSFIVNFAAIEAQSYEWLRQLGRSISSLQEAMGRPFGARVDLVLSLVEGLTADAALKQEAGEAWQAARNLAQFRNTLAHGPLVLGWQGSAKGDPDFIGILDYKSATGDRLQVLERFSLETVRTAADDAAHLAQDLGELLERLKAG